MGVAVGVVDGVVDGAIETEGLGVIVGVAVGTELWQLFPGQGFRLVGRAAIPANAKIEIITNVTTILRINNLPG